MTFSHCKIKTSLFYKTLNIYKIIQEVIKFDWFFTTFFLNLCFFHVILFVHISICFMCECILIFIFLNASDISQAASQILLALTISEVPDHLFYAGCHGATKYVRTCQLHPGKPCSLPSCLCWMAPTSHSWLPSQY